MTNLATRDSCQPSCHPIQARTPPVRPLGVRPDAPTLVALHYDWEAGRQERLEGFLAMLAADPRRLFVLGRDKYETEVRHTS